MSLRFAAAHDPVRLAYRHATGRGLVARAQRLAANDNRPSPAAAAFDPLLTEALRHFGAHGLNAAKAALAEAKVAQTTGDTRASTHWLAITGMFDRRLAAAASSRHGPGRPSRRSARGFP